MGLEGNDALSGGIGNDVLDGGAGNDTLYGGGSGYAPNAGAGNDTYLFGRGYGQDTIYDYDTTAGNTDTIQLIGLNQSDVTLKREGKEFVISINGTSDVLRVADWSLGTAARIERVQFADGSVLEGAALVRAILGTAGNDNMIGTVDADILMGLGGNDACPAAPATMSSTAGPATTRCTAVSAATSPVRAPAATPTCSVAATGRIRSTTTTRPRGASTRSSSRT